MGCSGSGARQRPSSAAALRGSSPDFAVNRAPEVKTTRVWVRHDQRDTRDPLVSKARAGGAQSSGSNCGGGSVRRRSPARVHSSVSSTGSGWDRVSECVWCKRRPKRGLCGVLLRSSALATAERRYVRWRCTGMRCSGT